MVGGENGVNGQIVLLVVEVGPKEELEFVIVQLLNLGVMTVQLMVHWTWKHNHAMKILAQVKSKRI